MRARVEMPEPRSSLSGPANAVCTVTCWSRQNPIRSASGSRARSASASSSPVEVDAVWRGHGSILARTDQVDDAGREQLDRFVALECRPPERLGRDELGEQGSGALEVAAPRESERLGDDRFVLAQPRCLRRFALLGRVGVFVDPVAAPVGGGEPMQAAELGQRLGVIVDPQVEDALVGRALLDLFADDDQPGGLAAAEIASGRLGGVERGEEALRERPAVD